MSLDRSPRMRVQARSSRLGPRGVSVVLAIVMTATIMTGCSVAAGGGANVARGVPSGLKSALTNGIDAAIATFDGYTDDFARAVDPMVVAPPPALQRAVRQADVAVARGATLTPSEQRLMDVAENWIAAYRSWERILVEVIGWELSIPDDALRLATASFVREPSAEFQAFVVALEQKVLKGLMCTVAREGLDQFGEAQARSEPATYGYVGSDTADVAAYLDRAVVGVQGAFDVLDTWSLADASIELANDYIDGLVDVIDSPSTSVATANLIYFRNCVARPR